MNIKSISPTKLQLYTDCPRCFLLCMEGHPQKTTFDMTFGTRLHKAIEKYHREGLYFFDDDLQDYMDIYISTYDREYQVVEEFWKVPLFDTGIVLNTKVDLVKDDMLIDHKTSKRTFSQEYVDSMRQLTAYAYSWHQQYSEPEKNIRINLFNTNPKIGEELLTIIDSVRTQEQIDEWELWVRDILDGIAGDYFQPKEAMWHNYTLCPLYKARETTQE